MVEAKKERTNLLYLLPTLVGILIIVASILFFVIAMSNIYSQMNVANINQEKEMEVSEEPIGDSFVFDGTRYILIYGEDRI